MGEDETGGGKVGLRQEEEEVAMEEEQEVTTSGLEDSLSRKLVQPTTPVEEEEEQQAPSSSSPSAEEGLSMKPQERDVVPESEMEGENGGEGAHTLLPPTVIATASSENEDGEGDEPELVQLQGDKEIVFAELPLDAFRDPFFRYPILLLNSSILNPGPFTLNPGTLNPEP